MHAITKYVCNCSLSGLKYNVLMGKTKRKLLWFRTGLEIASKTHFGGIKSIEMLIGIAIQSIQRSQ